MVLYRKGLLIPHLSHSQFSKTFCTFQRSIHVSTAQVLAKEFISNFKGITFLSSFVCNLPSTFRFPGGSPFSFIWPEIWGFLYSTPLCTSYNYASVRPSSRRREREKEHSSFDWRGRFPSFRVLGTCFGLLGV